MGSEREKREEEIQRLIRGEGRRPESDVAFQEKIRKAASAILEEETVRIRKEEKEKETGTDDHFERLQWPSWAFKPKTLAVGLIVISAGLAFVMPVLAGAVLIGAVALLWKALAKPSGKQPSPRRTKT